MNEILRCLMLTELKQRKKREGELYSDLESGCLFVCVCVCVCEWVRERDNTFISLCLTV